MSQIPKSCSIYLLIAFWQLITITPTLAAQPSTNEQGYYKQGQYKKSYDDKYYQTHEIKQLYADDSDVDLLILGDWGRNGHYAQRSVAKWMDIASHYLDAEMVVTTGDNFYDNGVASIDDPIWNTSFEQIYQGPNLFIDWYPTLGNHDYRGNWQAQIDYSQVSRRWELPAQYYEKLITLDDGTQAHLLFIDTSPLNPDYQGETKYQETQKQDADAQLTWLHQTLSSSKADWRIVFGHHPLYSSGKRYGATDGIKSVLEPILEKYRVHAYFAGHEHDLQHNQVEGKTVEHFISGASSKLRPTGKVDFTRFSSSSAGFAALSIGTDALVMQFIADNGNVGYRYNIEREAK
jgi:hypothetical protein